MRFNLKAKILKPHVLTWQTEDFWLDSHFLSKTWDFVGQDLRLTKRQLWMLLYRPQHGWTSLKPKINTVRSKQVAWVQRLKRSARQHPSYLVSPPSEASHISEKQVGLFSSTSLHRATSARMMPLGSSAQNCSHFGLTWKDFFWWKAEMGVERSKWSIRRGWLLILPYSLPSFLPLWSVTLALFRITLKVFDVSCLSLGTLSCSSSPNIDVCENNLWPSRYSTSHLDVSSCVILTRCVRL